MIYLLDTDTVIYLMRGLKLTAPKTARQKESLAIGKRIFNRAHEYETAGHEIALSSITVAELEFGARHSQHYAREIEIVHRILTPFTLLDFDAAGCAKHYGQIRHTLEASGKIIGAMDLLIASHALATSAILVSNNTTEFARVPGLKIENWTKDV